MNICYCKQASGGATALLRNQETPRGTELRGMGRGWSGGQNRVGAEVREGRDILP